VFNVLGVSADHLSAWNSMTLWQRNSLWW